MSGVQSICHQFATVIFKITTKQRKGSEHAEQSADSLPIFVRARPCFTLWSFSLIRKTELLVAFNITSGIEVSFFSAKSRTLLIYRYQKKEDTLRNLYEKKKEKLISYICFLASLGLKVTILFSVILNFLIFPVSESLNLYSNSSTHSLMRYKSIKQLKTKIQEDIY